MRILVFAAVLLIGCDPVVDDDDAADPTVIYAFPEADATEDEPNDTSTTADSLGVIPIDYAVTGESTTCGSDGTFDGADIDWLSFTPTSADPIRLRLDMRGGDLDLAIFDADGNLVADGATVGVEDEELALALDPNQVWLARIRCFLGNDGAIWRLRLL